MWSHADFDKLKGNIHFPVVVDWDKRPSPLKYGHVNSLLAVICALQKHQASFTHPDGSAINALAIAPVKRRLTDLPRIPPDEVAILSTRSPILI